MEYLIGIDIGTTNCKVGVCNGEYELLQLYTMQTPQKGGQFEKTVYDVEKLLRKLSEMLEKAAAKYPPSMIAITSMAEAGAFVEEETERLMSDIIPWRDMDSETFVTDRDRKEDRIRFQKTGLHVAYKYSLFKVLAYKAENGSVDGLVFLPAASLVAYFLTGRITVDITLAARTYACDIYKKKYDKDLLEAKGLSAFVFPEITDGYAGIWKRGCEYTSKSPVKVFVSGHDHVCASVAAGISVENQEIFLSLGTTGVAMGCMAERPLSEKDYDSGYVFGCHPRKGQMTWLGAIQSAGASIDWVMRLMGIENGEYEIFKDIVLGSPSDVLFFPYINGSGPPKLNSGARGALLGLPGDIVKTELLISVMQGVSFEIRSILENTGNPYPTKIKAVGGCTENKCLMQILSDIVECEIVVPAFSQSALIGAVMIGKGDYFENYPVEAMCRFLPEKKNREKYRELYREYLKLQPMILNYRRNK